MKQRGMTEEQIRKSICEAVHSSAQVEGSSISLEEVYIAYDELQKRKDVESWKNYRTKEINE